MPSPDPSPRRQPGARCRSSADWPAPTADDRVDADVALPGSKSLTNRFLVLAALANGPSRLRRPLRSRDTLLMAAGAARARRRRRGRHRPTGSAAPDWVVTPATLRGGAHIDCGLAGTVMRFLPPVAALCARARRRSTATRRPGSARWARCSTRCAPSGPQVDDGGRGTLPFTVHGTGRMPGGSVTLDASASSQFISALLLAGPRYDDGVTVHHDGKPVPSEPHIEMTVETLRDAGAIVDDARAQHLAGRALRDQRRSTSRSSPTCPTPRRSSPPRWSPAAG